MGYRVYAAVDGADQPWHCMISTISKADAEWTVERLQKAGLAVRLETSEKRIDADIVVRVSGRRKADIVMRARVRAQLLRQYRDASRPIKPTIKAWLTADLLVELADEIERLRRQLEQARK